MQDKRGLEFGTEVNLDGDNATVYDMLPNNASMIKIFMLNGPYKGVIMLAVLKRVEKGFK